MEDVETEDRAARITEAIQTLEPEPGQYQPCGVEDVDRVYPMVMNDRPRQKPAACTFRRGLVQEYLDAIEASFQDN